MTQADGRPDVLIETPMHVLRRFGIKMIDADVTSETAAMSMPLAGMRNPVTDMPTVGPLGILVDAVSGFVNHFRHEPGEWTVSTELTLDLSPDGSERATADDAAPVVAVGQLLGPRGSTSLSFCTLTCGDVIIGGGTVRSFFLTPDRVVRDEPEETLRRTASTPLSELMAVQIGAVASDFCVLRQRPDPFLDNAVGVVNGGVASAGLELAASAVINAGGPPMRTASLRVNFLRPFFAGEHSRYEAAPLRIGRTTAVADAQALTEDGRPALTARVTAYR
ncbi:phenylacetic acid degradation protein [Mycobacterium gallinarum]|uniref:Phenylacetic acid degradation protein n=1 Tax=Mycobacterium gallinarum TaxID=39689 RepID=A0A9W4B9B7_9MYCO|nr:PaaI family thioesterase [Mycobacterium gallinarum]BBY93350.1 phenylacetic acid degradation protein [Mycobacterium gallinarum]